MTPLSALGSGHALIHSPWLFPSLLLGRDLKQQCLEGVCNLVLEFRCLRSNKLLPNSLLRARLHPLRRRGRLFRALERCQHELFVHRSSEAASGDSVLVGTRWLCVPGLTSIQLPFKSGSMARLFGPGVRGWGHTAALTGRSLPGTCHPHRLGL